MKKNSHISQFVVVLHAIYQRGFFAAPLCPVFSVRPAAKINYGRPTPEAYFFNGRPTPEAYFINGRPTPVRVRR